MTEEIQKDPGLKKGERIGVYLHGGETFFLVGYGTYGGDVVPPIWIENYGMNFAQEGKTNPMLVLDDGRIFWGCYCWWGPEEDIKRLAEGAEEIVDVKESCEDIVAEAAVDEALDAQLVPEKLRGEMNYGTYVLAHMILKGAGAADDDIPGLIEAALPATAESYTFASKKIRNFLARKAKADTEKWKKEQE